MQRMVEGALPKRFVGGDSPLHHRCAAVPSPCMGGFYGRWVI